MNIGILALQGAFLEHGKILESLNINYKFVRNISDFESCDSLIIPGGESTSISKLLKSTGLDNKIISSIKNGMPVFGTCAGMILLAKEVVNQESHLAVMNICVKRNAYGRQLGSFSFKSNFQGIIKPIEMVFIRAPYIHSILSSDVEILAKVNDKIVAARDKNLLVTSFHPELTNDSSVHKFFIDNIINKKLKN